MRRDPTVVVSILLFLLMCPWPGLATQVFTLRYDSFQDFDGDGRIDCSEPVTYRIALVGTNISTGGDRGTITVPFSDPERWTYTPGSFVFDPVFSESCTYSIVSGGSPPARDLVLNYVCDPRSGNPQDDNYALSFRVSGLYLSTNAGPIVVDAQNARTFPDSLAWTDTEASTAPLQPCPPPPDLKLTKSLTAGNGNPGNTLVYTLSLDNTGGPAAGVTLQENVPNSTTFSPAGSSAGWSCLPDNAAGASCTLSLGSVAGGASLTRTFAVVVDSTLPADPGGIDNTACATTSTAGDPPGNNCDSTSTPPGGTPDLRVTKTVASGSGEPGATLVYQLAVINQGNRGAAAATLEETVPNHTRFSPTASSPGWTCSPNGNAGAACTLILGTLDAGASLDPTFAVVVDATLPADPGNLDNTACATTSTPGDPAANNCGSTSTPPGGHPVLRLSKTVASGSGDPGSTLLYQLAVANEGNRDAAGVSVEEQVPPYTMFSPGGSSPGWSCSPDGNAGASCTLAFGTVAAGSSVTRSFAVVVDPTLPANARGIDNRACATTSTPGDPNTTNCGSISTPPGGSPDLELMKTTKAGTTTPGDTLVYQLELRNRGNRGTDSAILRETVPAATTWDPAASSPGWTCSDAGPGGSCFLPIGTVEAGTSVTRDFAVRIASPLPPGTVEIANTACVEGQADPEANNCSTVTTPPGGNPDLHLEKTLASGTLAPGAVLTYDLALTNEGNRAATSVVLQETVPADTTFESAASSPEWSCSPGTAAGATCTLTVGSLPAGTASTYQFAVRVRPDLPRDRQIANTACVSQTPGGNDPPGNDCATLITDPPMRQKTDIELSLAVDEPVKQVGDEFSFVLTLRNASDVPAQNLRVTVTLPNFGTPPSDIDQACRSIADVGLECSLPSLAPGEQVSFAWAQAASQAASYLVTADLALAEPDDLDSTPGNAVRTEDDFAELSVDATLQPVVHDVPALTPAGVVAMSGLLLALGIAFLMTRRIDSPPV